MGRKAKYTALQKIQACEDYIGGKYSAVEIAQKLALGKRGEDQVRFWSKLYEAHGQSVFEDKPHNSNYSIGIKQQAITDYLHNGLSLADICVKYKIYSHSTVSNWVTKYNEGEEIKEYDPKPEVYMTKQKKTTVEERIKIVKYCLENNRNYKLTAATFEVSYSQVHNWVKKYLTLGEEGVSDKRGRNKATEELSELEKLQRLNKQLQRENEELQRKNELLKKLEALERRD